MDPVQTEDLRKDKAMLKLHKKQAKDLEQLKKRHLKERVIIQKNQCCTMEKLLADLSKKQQKISNDKGLSKSKCNGSNSASASTNSANHVTSTRSPTSISCSSSPASPRDRDINEYGHHDESVHFTVSQQTEEWSVAIKRQLEEEYKLQRSHIDEEWEMLKKLLDEAHEQQMQQLKIKLEKYFNL